MLICEWKKLRTSGIWVPVLAGPLLAVLVGILMARMDLGSTGNGRSWPFIYGEIVHIYAVLFLPMLAGILASLCCRSEHLSGGWKQLLTLPISRTSIYAAKFFYVLLFLALIQGLVLVGVLIDGLILPIKNPIPWNMLSKGFFGGWIATIPLAALQLWVSTWWKSFGTPFALNVILTIPAMEISGSSTLAPIYPWAQPMLAMLPSTQGILNMTMETAITITIAGAVFIIGGWLHFIKRDVYS